MWEGKILAKYFVFYSKLKMFVKYLNIINFSIKKLIKTSKYGNVLVFKWVLASECQISQNINLNLRKHSGFERHDLKNKY